jgi:hypothetical protein
VSSDSAGEARPLVRVVVSWVMVVVGLLAGLFALASFGIAWLPLGGEHTEWWGLSEPAGLGLIAISFLAGSLIALRDPIRGSVFFLTFLPFAAFCFVYSETGLYIDPFPILTLIGLTFVFFVPIFALVVRVRNRKRALLVFTVGMLIAILVFGYSRWTSDFLPRLTGDSAPFLVFGIFWLGAHEFRWPVLMRGRPQTPGRRVANVAITWAVILCAAIPLAAARAAYTSRAASSNCGKRPPFTHALSADHAAFIARTVYVGFSLQTRLQLQRLPVELRNDPRFGEWAIGVVQERFWGIPSRWPRLVLLTGDVYWKGETYFIDGTRERSVLDRVLPVVRGTFVCGRSQPVQDAVVDLHLLHQQPLKSAAIVGYVRQPGTADYFLTPPGRPSYLGGARIDVSGPEGTKSVTTDGSGIYELDGLSAGGYTVQLHVPDGQVAGLYGVDGSFRDDSVRKIQLKSDGVAECNFRLDWRRSNGKPQR